MTASRPTPTALDARIAERLRGHRLVCEVDWDEEMLYWVRMDWDGLRRGQGNARYVARKYPALNLLFMVVWGLRKYDHNEFWTDLHLNSSEQRTIGEEFEKALAAFGLETFPQFFAEERARRFVTIILAHGGIPTSSAEPFLRRALVPALSSGSASSATELISLWRANRPAVFTKPVERFLFHGGETAVDLLDRLISMVRTPRLTLEADPDAAGVPRHLVKAFLSIPETEVARAARWPSAEILLHPYEGSGPQLVLPPLDKDLAQDFSWEVDDGSGEPRVIKGFRRRDVEPISLLPSGFWTVTARRGSDERRRDWECFGEEPLVCFDERGSYLPDAGGIRADAIWVVAKDDVTLSSVEESGLRPLTGEPGAALPSTWRGHSVRRYDLRGVHLLSVAEGGSETIRMRVHRPKAGVEVIADPVRDARSAEGDQVLAALPHLSLPPGTAWRIVLDGPDGRTEHLVPAADAARTVDLTQITAPTLGHYDLNVRGTLGQDLPPVAFGLVPGLVLETPDDPCVPGCGDVDVPARADADIGLHGKQPGQPVTITIPAGEDTEELWAWEHKRKQGVLVSVPRLQWAFRGEDELPVFGQDTPHLRSDSPADQPTALLVATSRVGRRLFLRLEDGTGTQRQISAPVETDAAGRAVFDLTLFRETLRSIGKDGWRFRLLIGKDAVTVMDCRGQAEPKSDLPRLRSQVLAQVKEVRRSGLEVTGPTWDGYIPAERLLKPMHEYRPGQSIRATVIAIDGPRHVRLEGRTFDPGRFQLGQEVTGIVVRASDTSLRVDIAGYDAVIGAQRLPPNQQPSSWQPGATIRGRVVDISPARRLLRLAVVPFAGGRFRRAQQVTGRVTAATEGGLYLDLGGTQGWVPAKEEASGRRPLVGSTVSAWVEKIDLRREQVLLTMRPYNDGGWRIGQVVKVKVVKPRETIVLVSLPDGTTGGIPRGQMLPQYNGASDQPSVGTELNAKVIDLDPRQRRITLSAIAATSSYTFGSDTDESPFAVLERLVGSDE